jgi:hypothetical protein
MLMTGTITEPVVRVTPGRVLRRRSYGGSLSGQQRELRATLVAGVCIFGALPLFVGLVYLWSDGPHRPPLFFGGGLLLAIGWLFALVAGARTGCCDWLRSDECAPAARYQSPRTRVLVTFAAGAVVIALSFAAGVAADGALHVLGRAAAPDTSAAFPATGLAAAAVFPLLAMAVSYSLAFAAGVVTRQRRMSILLPVMLLATWAGLPFASNRFDFLLPASLLDGNGAIEGSASSLWAFGLAVTCCIAMSIATTVAASTRKRPFRAGVRLPAAMAAVLGVLLFVTTWTEAGTALTPVDQCWLPPASGESQKLRSSSWQLLRCGDVCFALSDGCIERHSEDRTAWMAKRLVATFRIDAAGMIQDYREAQLAFSTRPGDLAAPGQYVHPTDLCPLRHLIDLKVNEAGEQVITGLWHGEATAGLCRIRIAWPADEEPRVVSRQLALLPEGQEGGRRHLIMASSTDRHACLVCASDARASDSSGVDLPYEWPRTLYRFAWSNESGLDLACERPAEFAEDSAEYRAIVNPEPPRGSRGTPQGLVWQTVAWCFDLEAPRPGLPTLRATGYARWNAAWDRASEFLAALDRPGGSPPDRHEWPTVTWDSSGRLACARDRLGLQVVRVDSAGDHRVVGEHRSPRFLRSLEDWQGTRSGSSALIDGSILAQVTGERLVLYDVSDVTRPRPTGYFTLPPQMTSPQVFDVGGYVLDAS